MAAGATVIPYRINETHEVSFRLLAHDSTERYDRADDGKEDEEDRS